MQIPFKTDRWYDELCAAFIFYTRLPFSKLHQPPQQSFMGVMEYWPLTSWLSASIAAAIVYFGSSVMPYAMALIVALLARIIITGAANEDGLARFVEGFITGGGTREGIVSAMRQPKVGSYGLITIIAYEALLFVTLLMMPPIGSAICLFAAEPFSKMLAGELNLILPYLLKADESKTKVGYRKMTTAASIFFGLQGLLPLVPFFLIMGAVIRWEMIIFVPCLVMYFIYYLIFKKLRGYTEECCATIATMVELSFYIVAALNFEC